MGDPMNLRISLMNNIGYCSGIRNGLKVLRRTILFAKLTFNTVYYKDPPQEADGMICSLKEKRVPIVEWHSGLSHRSIQYICPYGAKSEAYSTRNADGTCKNVRRVFAEAIKWYGHGYKVIIIADRDSSEAISASSFIGHSGIIVSDFNDVPKLELKPDELVAVLAQTSFRPDLFDGLVREMRSAYPNTSFVIRKTICPEIHRRLNVLLANFNLGDKVIVVGDPKSKQARFLQCELAQYTKVYRAEVGENLGANLFKPGDRVVITSTTSASRARILAIMNRLSFLTSDDQVTVEVPDPCEGCSKISGCKRHQCSCCQCN